jgi:hypothetical protein
MSFAMCNNLQVYYLKENKICLRIRHLLITKENRGLSSDSKNKKKGITQNNQCTYNTAKAW